MSTSKRPSSSREHPKKRQKKVLDLEAKMEIIRRLEQGEGPSEIGRHLGINESTVRAIRSKKEAIKFSIKNVTPLSAKKLKHSRSPLLERMETLLMHWIEDNNQKKIGIDTISITTKAKKIYDHLKQQEENTTSKIEDFVASKGWFDRFRKRHNLHNIHFTGEASSADHVAAQKFPQELKYIIEAGGYTAQQVFNADETGLYWKRMPGRTYISKEEKRASGFKASKDRLTLLLCGNAAGDFKCKPLLIYQSENPRAFKNIKKEDLPVHWRSNKKAWMTSLIFNDWFTKCFCPEVERYCQARNINFKGLLILDNATSHSEALNSLNPNIKVVFMPPNTTSIIQPMDQGIISVFKKLYLRNTFNAMLEATDGPNKPTLRDFWRSYSVLDAISNVKASWNGVKNTTMNAVWKKVWPDCVARNTVDTEIDVQDLVTLGRRIGGDGFLDLEESDIHELINLHDAELAVEELIEISEQGEPVQDEEEVAPIDHLSIKNLEHLAKIINEATSFAESIDINPIRSSAFKKGLDDSFLPYKLILEGKKADIKQPTILKFFSSTRSSATETNPGDNSKTGLGPGTSTST